MKHQQLNLLFIINSSAVSIISYTKTTHETFSDLKRTSQVKRALTVWTPESVLQVILLKITYQYIFFPSEIWGTNINFHLHCDADIPATTIRSGTCMVTLAFGNPSWVPLSRSAFWGATLSFSGTLMRWLMPSVYSISYCSRFISAISAAGDGNAAPLILPGETKTLTARWEPGRSTGRKCSVLITNGVGDPSWRVLFKGVNYAVKFKGSVVIRCWEGQAMKEEQSDALGNAKIEGAQTEPWQTKNKPT